MAGEVKRMNYYNGLFLKEDDFKCEQNYHIRMLRLHNQLLHNTYGVAEGLEVLPSGTKNFLVRKGAAIAQFTTEDGEEQMVCILLTADREIEDLKDKVDGVWYVTISYDDETRGEIDKNKGDKEIHIIERPKIKCDASAPSGQNKKDILLAKIVLTGLGANWTSSAGMIKTDVRVVIQKGIGSIDGISNPGGNVDLLASDSISITSDISKKSITIGETHSAKTGNPHGTTAAQVGALPLAGGTITGSLTVQGNSVLGNEDADTVTIEGLLVTGHSSGRLNIGSPVAFSGPLSINATTSEISFQDNGQIRSFDDKHRILFRRPENKLELREFGDIIFSPGATAGTETAKAVMLSNGNVGIGTISPAAKLSVKGGLHVGGDSDPGNNNLQVDGIATFGGERISMDGSKNIGRGIEWYYADNDRYGLAQDNGGIVRLYGSNSYANTSFRVCLATGLTTFTDLMTVTKNGKVGIGTANPSSKLEVNGSIRSPMWNISQVFDQKVGALPVEESFSTGGGILVIFASGSGFSNVPGKIIGMEILIDAVKQGETKTFTNEAGSHKAFTVNALVVSGITAGSHKIKLNAIAGTSTDINDFFNVTIMELPWVPDISFVPIKILPGLIVSPINFTTGFIIK